MLAPRRCAVAARRGNRSCVLVCAPPWACPRGRQRSCPAAAVHIGYFLATVKPVLTIVKDIVTIESAASVVPSVVDQSGVVPPSAVRNTSATSTAGEDRGPGPHILTGPIEIAARPGDVLDVASSISASCSTGNTTASGPYTGALPEEFTALWSRIIPINREAKTAEVAKGVVVPVDKPFFGTMGLAPDPTMGRISSGPPGAYRQPRQQGPDRRHHALHAGAAHRARCSRPATRTRRRATARWT